MDRSDAASLAFKLAGIYVVVEAIKLVPTIAIPLRNAVEANGVNLRDVALIGIPLLISLVALTLLAFFLIVWSHRFGARALGEPSQDQIDFRGEARELQAVAFSIIGLALLASAVPELVDDIAAAIHDHDHLWSHLRSQAPDLIVLFLQVSAGSWLFLMPRAVRTVWEWLGGRIGER